MAVYFTLKAANGATVRFDNALAVPDDPVLRMRSGEVAERIRLKCARAYELACTPELREETLAHMTRHIAPSDERERVIRRIRELSPELPAAPSDAMPHS